MATRIKPLKPGESPDSEVNELLEQGRGQLVERFRDCSE